MGDEGSGQDEADLRFWLQYLHIGNAITGVTGGVGMVYVLGTWRRSNRPALAVIAAGALALAAVVAVIPHRRLLSSRWRGAFFFAWSVSCCLLVAVAAHLDGGIDSPLTELLFLPLIFVAMAYGPASVAALSTLILGSFSTVAFLDGSRTGAAHLLFTGASITLVAVMAALTARSHVVQYRRQVALSARLAELADHDGLTGCLNHRAFHESLRAEVQRASRHAHPLALLAVDLDNFKAINDRHGHPIGDAVLRAVAGALRAGARAEDTVARIGGEEFALLLPETTLDAAETLARRLREQVVALPGPLPVTVSIGVSAYPEPARSAADLLAQADRALYAAKGAGRDHVCTAGRAGDRHTPTNGRRQQRGRVERLVRGEGLVVRYQPITAIDQDGLLGFEALAGVDRSGLGPDQWLRLADACGLRSRLEAAVWEAALAPGPPPDGAALFLGVGTRTLVLGHLDHLRDRLPPATVLEVSGYGDGGDGGDGGLREALARWRAAGCRIALDDVGHERVDPHHVLELAPDFLKLDRTITSGIHGDTIRLAMVEAIVAFTDRTGQTVIAEAVDDRDDADALVRIGVHYGQGELLGPAAPPWPVPAGTVAGTVAAGPVTGS